MMIRKRAGRADLLLFRVFPAWLVCHRRVADVEGAVVIAKEKESARLGVVLARSDQGTR